MKLNKKCSSILLGLLRVNSGCIKSSLLLSKRFYSYSLGIKPKFNLVRTIYEDPRIVAYELPDVKDYLLKKNFHHSNPYRDIPISSIILTPDEIKEFKDSISNISINTKSRNTVYDYELNFSILENGLKIVSSDCGEFVSKLSLYIHAGSRFETSETQGVSHFLQLMAFKSTEYLSYLQTIRTLEILGANAGSNANREHIVYNVECLREYSSIMIPLLIGNISSPRFLRHEIRDARGLVENFALTLNRDPETLITEMMHTVAWNNTLGNQIFASESSLQHFNEKIMRSFMQSYFIPERMIFVGTGIEHNILCKWVMRSFTNYTTKFQIQKTRPISNIKPNYTGGEWRKESNDFLTHIAIALETSCGWTSKDIVPLYILQAYMGGGGSFSTGGPGKGMYTKLFLDVLNRYEWVETCNCFVNQYSDSGLFGIYISVDPQRTIDALYVISKELNQMKNLDSEELQRAKNAIKGAISINSENRSIAMDDIAKQLLCTNEYISTEAFCKAVDTVTKEDIVRISEFILRSIDKPTLVIYGNTNYAPTYREIVHILQGKSV
ncbi:peptidase M16 inactive domain-containing protein [Cryptosporidium muris RN66]|uniref:Peptidase M16 inactive domain-containing protein n=1 Tax=Cryptosporidium muris (strain RN66) TaxID=441375 RepID=B6AFN5_CRYMR|nr:peptidase M16 inactive domain-containing protein [Cryptosporidium muris RN66]EEA07026.1 peptidase M16 inactive domain-containing protein [Cryptosporidium muris RN66]|eukprot:XP_002141375.1 peptidase M16 inactive domain-containing protein [Cryptosporidium muris RN66]